MIDRHPAKESLAVEARRMLQAELIKQPALTTFFTAESWKRELVPFLIEDGYLGMTRKTGTGEFLVNDVLPKALELLATGPEDRSKVERNPKHDE